MRRRRLARLLHRISLIVFGPYVEPAERVEHERDPRGIADEREWGRCG